MLDDALTGEGQWTFWRRWKPRAMEVTADGWWPLRWCLEVTPAVCFPGGEVDIELSLADEDVLPSGRYEARLAVVGPGGWRWQRSVDFPVEHGTGLLAVPVLSERIAIDVPPRSLFLCRLPRDCRLAGGRSRSYRGDCVPEPSTPSAQPAPSVSANLHWTG